MQTKIFKSPVGTLRVALTSGHVALIDENGIELDEKFWKEAYAVGALTGDMEDVSAIDKAERAQKEKEDAQKAEYEKLIKFLEGVYDDPRTFLDKNNKPLASKVVAASGVKTDKKTILKLWDIVVSSRG